MMRQILSNIFRFSEESGGKIMEEGFEKYIGYSVNRIYTSRTNFVYIKSTG